MKISEKNFRWMSISNNDQTGQQRYYVIALATERGEEGEGKGETNRHNELRS